MNAAHLRNALFGMADYAAYPLGMLLLAPLILRELGVERFGVWAMANAAWNTGAVLASGFGDANIRAVAEARARGQHTQIVSTVRSALAIHLLMGTSTAAMGWIAASWMARSAAASSLSVYHDCLWSLRIAAVLILLRALETVCISTQRAFARYGRAIQLSLAARLLSLAAAWLAPLTGGRVHVVMLWTLAISATVLWLQLRQLKALLGLGRITPLLRAPETRTLARFGVFTWVQAVATLLLGQVDRLVAGISFGAAAVTSYTLCVQLAQPVYGLCASGLHFVFPYVASRATSHLYVLAPVVKALIANLVLAGTMLCFLLAFGHPMLRAWAGARVATEAEHLLAPIVWSSALSAMAVTAAYGLLALNRPRTVTAFHLLGSVATVAAIPLLVPRFGVEGLAYARLMFGPAVLLAYIPLFMTPKRSTPHPREDGALTCLET